MAKVKEYKGAFGSDVTSDAELADNLASNAIPESFVNATHKDFFEFMEQRRKLMSLLVKDYYDTL